MPTSKLKMIGKKAMVYTLFLTFVMSFMIFGNFEEKLSAEEVAAVQSFQALGQVIEPIQSASLDGAGSGIRYGYVNEDALNVRTGPGLDYPVYRMLFRNDEVQLLEEMDGGWWKIALDGYAYYVSSEFIVQKNGL